MGKLAKILSFLRADRDGVKVSEVKVDPDGGSNVTADHMADAGDDSFPLKTDYAIIIPVPRSGGEAVVGYADPVNEPKAGEGEKRIYARDPDLGDLVNEVWLKSDGSILIANDEGFFELKVDGSILMSNDNGSFELKADGAILGDGPFGSFELEIAGDFVVNGAKITLLGDVITALGKSLNNHVHPINSGSSAPGPTGPPV